MAKIPFYSIKSLIGGSGGGGGTTEVKVDGVTVEKLTGSKLQANAIIPVTELPSRDIKAKSIYQKQDGEFIKNYIYANNKWQSVSVIDLKAQQYGNLTNEQKTDGTLYIVSDDTNPQITWTYSALSGKPIINGVTIDGKLTLEDLQLYSRHEVNNLLAQKGNALFVDELPTEMQPLYWYYSKKHQDGTAVADGKRALYIKDGNGTLQYMGVTGDVDLANYYMKDQANDVFIPKSSLKTTIDDTATDTDVISGKAVFDMYNSLKVEDVTNILGKSSTFKIQSFNALKIGERFLYLRFQLTKSGTLNAGSEIALTLSKLKNAGITNSESAAGALYVSAGSASTFYNKNSNTIYIYAYTAMNNPSMHFSYLIPINL